MSDQFPYGNVAGETDVAKVVFFCSEAIFNALQELISRVSELIEVVENKSL